MRRRETAAATAAAAALLLAALASPASAAPSLSCGDGLCFSSGLSTGGVLQRAPARAALYGSAHQSSPVGAAVVVTLRAADGSPAANATGAVAADRTWRALLPPMPTGGNYSVTADCAACTGQRTAVISDLTFGDVIFCAGQSNMWLPLWFTFERNLTTARVLAGAYDNIRIWRGGLGQVTDGGNWVAPAGIEPGSDSGEALTNQWRRPADVASTSNEIRPGEPWLWEYPATCFYAAQFLTDLLGEAAPPFGLMTVPVGGTMLEEWSAPETQAAVKNVTCMCMDSKSCDPFGPLGPQCTKNSDLYYGNVQPFANMTLKMWLWYQVSVHARRGAAWRGSERRGECAGAARQQSRHCAGALTPAPPPPHRPPPSCIPRERRARTTCNTMEGHRRSARATARCSPR